MIRFITRFLQVGLFSTAIAVLIWWLIEFGDFLPVLLVSLSIGWSVHLAFVLAHDWLSGRIGPWLAPIPIVALGLAAGLVSAAPWSAIIRCTFSHRISRHWLWPCSSGSPVR